MVYDATEGLPRLLARSKSRRTSASIRRRSSLHVGSLLPVMALARLQRFGHSPIAIVGGGTGMIGDPSGKSQERELLSPSRSRRTWPAFARSSSACSISIACGATPARIVNNADWLGTIDLMSFLRDTGKHFTVNYMLQKESVNRRLESEEGISFTEFSYLLLQAYDFLQLFDRYGCTLQMGGSDQWGNITAGIDLIRKLRGAEGARPGVAADDDRVGAKFGKTEAGTVWLDPSAHLAVRFYQFWLNTDDRDVVAYLKYFTFLDRAGDRRARGDGARAPGDGARRSACWRAR